MASATGALSLSSTRPEIALVPWAEADAEAAQRSASMASFCNVVMRLEVTSLEPPDSGVASYRIQALLRALLYRCEQSCLRSVRACIRGATRLYAQSRGNARGACQVLARHDRRSRAASRAARQRRGHPG